MLKLICIGGGMGPMAGVEFHKLIIQHTETKGIEQNHIEVHHFSRPHDITDRIQFILNNKGENPAEGMFRTVMAGYAAAQSLNRKMVLAIPCITFHAPIIFNRLLELVNQNELNIEVLSIVDVSVIHIQSNYPTIKKIGLLSTNGCRGARIFHDRLEALNYELIEVPIEMQNEVQASISNPVYGIKTTYPNHDKAIANFNGFANHLIDLGAEAIILGCTEIPLALPQKDIKGVALINPSEILAKAAIKAAS